MPINFITDEDAPKITGKIHRVKHSKDDPEGLRMGIHIEGGNLILDMGQSIQYLGMSIDEAKAFTIAMVHAVGLAIDDHIPVKDLN